MYKGEIKAFTDKQKLRVFITTRSASHKLNGSLDPWNEMKTWNENTKLQDRNENLKWKHKITGHFESSDEQTEIENCKSISEYVFSTFYYSITVKREKKKKKPKKCPLQFGYKLTT